MSKAASREERALLCIVDPSLKDFVGHHFEYDAAVASGATEAGYEAVCLAHRNVDKAVSDALSVRPSFTYDIWEGQQAHAEDPIEVRFSRANTAFLADLDLATRDLAIDERTIIFGHMITAAQLAGWAAFARRMRGRNPTLVLLCRYELAHYRGEGAARAFRDLERLVQAGVRIRLASDSQRLARHFARLTSLPVEVFPIPHTQAHGLARQTPARADGRPLVVSMLGNARDEKGWVELIAAVEVLAAQGRAQAFRFVVQANNPDAACRRVLERLGADVPSCIELKTQALEPQAYAALLEDSDIVVLPYWRSIYEARTSGVLVEALSAGKPVICTEATWLSDQITQGQGRQVKDRNPADLAAHLWTMRNDYARYAQAARKAREGWVAYHNPASLVAALTRGAPPAEAAGVRVAMLYPWGDAQQGGSGASLRVNLLTRYLAARAETVTVLEDAHRWPATIDGVHYEAYPLLEQSDASRFGRWLRRWIPALLRVTGGEELYLLLHIYPRLDRIFRRQLEEVVRSSDVVFLEYSFWAAVVAPICRELGKPLVVTAHDVVADQVRSSRAARWLTGWLEVQGLRKGGGRVAVVSAPDQAAFARRGVAATLIPQFVDVDGLRAMPPVERTVLNRLIDLPQADRSALFVFIGSRFEPNQVAAAHLREIATATRAEHPDLAFRIVVAGSCFEPTREDAFLALGRVDEAILPLLYQHATAVVIPLTMGTGASLKTAEAFGAGAPVLGTSVAFRGFEVAPRLDCIIEDDLSAWPARLAELVRDPALAEGLRAGAVRRGDGFDYRTACEAYLSLAPEIGREPVERGLAPKTLPNAVLALVRTGWKAGVGEALAPYLQALRLSRPDDPGLAQIEAELLANGGPAEAIRAAQLFRIAFEGGAPPEPSLYGLFKTSQRLGETEVADWAQRLAGRLLALQAAHPDGEALLREALWRHLHKGEHPWVLANAGRMARFGPSVHMDYHYLFALLETGETADHAVAITHAEIALAAGFDRYWSLSLIASHQTSLGRDSDAADTLTEATAAASDEDQRQSAINARLTSVWELFHKRELEQALRQISRLLVDAPDMSGAYYVRAECRRLLADGRDETIADYERAEQLGHDPAWCRLHSGRLLTDARRMEAAGERLISAFPGLADADKLQCWRDGMIDVAQIGVDHMPLDGLVALIAQGARLDLTNNALLRWLAIHPPGPQTESSDPSRERLVEIVGSNFERGDYRRVLEQACDGLKEFLTEPIFRYYAAECLQLLGQDLDVAEIYYTQALDLEMHAFWPLMNRGQLRRKLGRWHEARADIEGALGVARNEAETAQAAKSLSDLKLDRPQPI